MKSKVMEEKNTAYCLDWITTGQAAKLLQITRATLSNWRRRKIGPPWYLTTTGYYLYRKTEIAAWLEKPRDPATIRGRRGRKPKTSVAEA
jgi:hypothetical protein